jgi:hypothetical protein
MSKNGGELEFHYKEDAIQYIFDEVLKILIDRRIYGTDNIMMFGQKGVLVRMFDKLQRVKQIVWEGLTNTDKNEKVTDNVNDIIGYGIIWRLIDEEYWLLPWRADTVIDDTENKTKGEIVNDQKKTKK